MKQRQTHSRHECNNYPHLSQKKKEDHPAEIVDKNNLEQKKEMIWLVWYQPPPHISHITWQWLVIWSLIIWSMVYVNIFKIFRRITILSADMGLNGIIQQIKQMIIWTLMCVCIFLIMNSCWSLTEFVADIGHNIVNEKARFAPWKLQMISTIWIRSNRFLYNK